MKKELLIDPNLCSGCLSCVTNCSQFHNNVVSPENSRIQVQLEPFSGKHEIKYCRQCEDAACVNNCPNEAIALSKNGEYYEINHELCDACKVCIEVCPYDAIVYSSLSNNIVKCQMCNGDPKCAQACFTGAIKYEEKSYLRVTYVKIEEKQKR